MKFGENVKILTILVELQDVWQIKFANLVKFAKFTKLFSRQASSKCICVLSYEQINENFII